MNLLHSLYDEDAADYKNGEGMQPMRKMQGMNGNLIFNIYHRSIPNLKSSQSLKGDQKPIACVDESSVWGDYSKI